MILHVITNFSNVGGAEKMLIRLLTNCNKPCILVSLMNVSDDLVVRLPTNVKVVSLGARGPIDMLFSVFKLITYFKKAKKVYCWMYHANTIGALTKLIMFNNIPLIWGVRHSLDDFASESFSTKTAIRTGKLLGRIPDAVIYCAERSLQQHLQYGYSPSSSAVYIPNGYKFGEFKPKKFNTEKLTIGAAGRFHEAKDFATFFTVVGKLQEYFPNLHVEVAGRNVNYENSTVEQWLSNLGVDKKRLTMHGELSDMSIFYNSIHFFALTSITEGFPNVLAEAASFGCICVSTDVGDASVIIADNKRIVPVKGVAPMVEVLTDLLNSEPNKLAQISKSDAMSIRDRFDIIEISRQIMEVGDK